MKKVLCLFFREPQQDGYLNTYKYYVFSEFFKKNFNIQILSFEKIQEHKVVFPKDSANTFGKICNLILGKPIRLTHYWSDNFLEEYISILDIFNPDIIYVEHLVMMQYVLKKNNNAKIIFYDDESVLFQKSFGLINSLKEKIKNFRLSNFETKALNSSDLILTISKEEKEYLQTETKKNVLWLPWPININKYEFSWTGNKVNSKFIILFLGNFIHYPNREALKIIVKNIYPALKNNRNILFRIVGINLHLVKKYIPNEFEVHEDVADVRPFLRTSDLFIAPIYSGGGMRIKVLEAAAIGIPLLISPLANFGFAFESEKDCFIVRNSHKFIDRIYDIINMDKEKLNEITANARKRIKMDFDEKKVKRQLLRLIKGLE